MYSASIRRSPPEWRERKLAMQAEARRKEKQAKQNADREQHLAEVEKVEKARLRKLDGMRLADPSGPAADGSDK